MPVPIHTSLSRYSLAKDMGFFSSNIVSFNLSSEQGSGLAQWLGRRISDQWVPGLSPGLAPFVVAS